MDAVLHLGPLPSGAEEGEPVGLYGWLSGADGYAVPDATICVKDDVELGSDEAIAILTTGADGAFSAAWTGAAAVRRLLGLLRRVRGRAGPAQVQERHLQRRGSRNRLRAAAARAAAAAVRGRLGLPDRDGRARDRTCPQVQALREYRDGTPLATGSGSASMSAFSAAYYSFSPHVADIEREHPAFRQAVAVLIVPMLHALSLVALADPGSEASVAAHGVAALLLVAGLYVAAPAGAAAAALHWRGWGRPGPGRRGRSL